MSDEPAYYFTDFNSLRLANALNIMMRGNTFVYYGDELGLKGTCPEGYDDTAAIVCLVRGRCIHSWNTCLELAL